MHLINRLVQNLDGYFFRENFIIASVVTVFVIRFFLKITHYPQLAGSGLHIAHLLWGGFFMLLALMLLMSFLGRGITATASVLGGVGFGAFIDELGKFITSDNNYFFQPTVAIMYVIFIGIYILSKTLSNRKTISEKEYLINALEMVREAVSSDLDGEEKKRALLYLKKSNQEDPLVKSLTTYITEVQSLPPATPSLLTRFKHFLSHLYTKTTQSQLIGRSIVAILLIQSFFNIGSIAIVFFQKPILSFAQIGELTSSTVSTLIVLSGLFLIRGSKVKAFKFFKVAILITLLVTQFFTFYEEQFRALVGLAINIVLLAVVDYSLDKEQGVGRG